MTAPPGPVPGPVFVGGSARSGTHAMGRLLDSHPRYHLIATEARFHSSPRGLPDLLAGTVSMEQFLERTRGEWWKRGYRRSLGLHTICGRARRERALAAFERDFPGDPWGSARALVDALFGQAVKRAGKPSWAEASGWNVQSGPTLVRLYPEAQFVNMVRDGRAVVGGHLSKVTLTDDPLEALRHWESRIRRADAAIRALPRDTVLTLNLDDLAARDRQRSLARLVEFLEIEDDAPMRAYFEREISAEAAHFGRWRERMPPPEARRVNRRYRQLVRELRRDGIDWAPAPDDRGGRAGRLRIPLRGR